MYSRTDSREHPAIRTRYIEKSAAVFTAALVVFYELLVSQHLFCFVEVDDIQNVLNNAQNTRNKNENESDNSTGAVLRNRGNA